MTTVPQSDYDAKETHIRPLDLRHDLSVVADLIEESFSLQQDPDGQAFLRSMRQASRDLAFVRWVGTWQDASSSPMAGYVWEDQGQIVGNVSLLPFTKNRKKIYLIANVAVAPSHRRQGIARALTIQAINHLRRKGVTEMWLQVNAKNQIALDLYQSLGFKQRYCRSAWQRKPGTSPNTELPQAPDLTVRKRKRGDWVLQKAWLLQHHPQSITWHLPVSFSDFDENVLWRPSRWEAALRLRHWALMAGEKPIAFLTSQKTDTFANNLWLAIDPLEDEMRIIQILLQALSSKLPKKRPLALEYPCGQADQAFESAGFSLHRSLIWMKYEPDAH